MKQMLRYLFVGDQATVAWSPTNRFIQQTQVDEVMVVSNIYDLEARLRSYELLAGVKELQAV